jgi:hypothetical protein
MEPTKLPRWGVPVVVMPVRKRVVLMGFSKKKRFRPAAR